jgi:hypothetical protein
MIGLITECCYGECHVCCIANKTCMLSVIMLSVIILIVIMLRVIMVSVIMLSVIMLIVIMLSVIMLSVIMLNDVMPTRQCLHKRDLVLVRMKKWLAPRWYSGRTLVSQCQGRVFKSCP